MFYFISDKKKQPDSFVSNSNMVPSGASFSVFFFVSSASTQAVLYIHGEMGEWYICFFSTV